MDATTPGHERRPPTALLGLIAALLLAPAFARADDRNGEQIYRQLCASCHGASGEGDAEEYPHPLAGKLGVDRLARLIGKTMPADDPAACEGEDAEKVAAYIYDAFYSPVAQARNAPPRVQLARLTVGQYRNALADLIGTFRWEPNPGDQRGLKGEYYGDRRFRRDRRVIERVDSEVDFDFGVMPPDHHKEIEPNEFSLRWQGSLIAPESGEYEFVVHTDHAMRLWVNDPKTPLIDAWVKSGDGTEFRAPINLIAGRMVPIRLEFSKAKQGVDDRKDFVGPPRPVPARIKLLWKRPKRVDEVIASRYLTPEGSPESFVVTTPFPPDDRSEGYERGIAVSKAWEEATTSAALEAAAYVKDHLDELAGAKFDAPDRSEKLRAFCARFTERAFRRPLTDGQRALYIDRQFETAGDPEEAVKRSVLLTLKSPRFLYLDLDGPSVDDAYDFAGRLAFALWDSLPDQALLDAAAKGELSNREQVTRHAERMVDNLRTRAKVRDFLLTWLKVDAVPDLSKDAEAFPGFDERIVADLRTSLELTLDDIAFGDEPDFRRLLGTDEVYLNGRLAKFYGAELPEDAPFQKVKLNPDARAGVLTHPYLMSTFAYTGTTSPIHRGVFLTRNVLGRALRPPPEAFAPLAPDLHPDLTTRERVALQTKPENCAQCHGLINPLGFALERFDAVGRIRDQEKGKPIDDLGWYTTLEGDRVDFRGARELAAYLSQSDEVRAAFAERMFQHLIKQPLPAYGPEAESKLSATFAEAGYSIRKLLVAIAAEAAPPRAGAPTEVAAAGE